MSALKSIAGVARTLVLLSIDFVAIAWGQLRNAGTYAGYVSFVRTDAIGDFIVWLKCAEIMRQLYTSRKAVLIANAAWAELARDIDIWDAVLPVDVRKFRNNLIYRFSIVSRLSAAGCAIVINSIHSRSYCGDDALVRATRAAVRIGSSGDSMNMKASQKARSDGLYSKLISVAGADESELVRHFQFIRGLGIDSPEIEVTDLTGYAASLHNPYAESGTYYVLAPGAGWAGRQWPADRYAAIAEHLEGAYGLSGVIVGGKTDAKLADRIVTSTAAVVRNAAGRTDVKGLIATIRDARLVVCNETSALHIAAALGVPSVCILGGGHFGRFAPYKSNWKSAGMLPVSLHLKMRCFGCNWKCVYDVPRNSAVPCVAEINVDDIVTAISDVMQRHVGVLDWAVARSEINSTSPKASVGHISEMESSRHSRACGPRTRQ